MPDNAPPTNASRPSKKQRELLGFIDSFIAGHGYGPSYREVMRALDYKSVSTVAIHINNLIAKGHLRKRDRSARSLEVLTPVARAEKSTVVVSRAEEKWLVERVEAAFATYGVSPTDKTRDNLFVLVGALHVLGLDAAAAAFRTRLPKG